MNERLIKAFILAYPQFEGVSMDYIPARDFDAACRMSVKGGSPELIDVIYAPDPVSGLPTGDFAQFMSDKTDPAVRAYIQQALLQPQTPVDSVPAVLEDSLGDLVRGRYETAFEYSQRLGSICKDSVNEYEALKVQLESIKSNQE